MAVKMVIETIFEADFCKSSYGFRPRKSAHQAVDDVAYAMNRGYTGIIDADLSKYFDTTPMPTFWLWLLSGSVTARYFAS
jgi:retron-type reverse transcriptase